MAAPAKQPLSNERRLFRLIAGLPGLGGNAKYCLEYLIEVAGGVERPAVVRAANIALLVAKSERSGLRYIEELEAYGLLKVLDRDRQRGHITVHVHDPSEVAGALRLRPGQSDGQGDLFPSDPESASLAEEETREVLDFPSPQVPSPGGGVSGDRNAAPAPAPAPAPSQNCATSFNTSLNAPREEEALASLPRARASGLDASEALKLVQNRGEIDDKNAAMRQRLENAARQTLAANQREEEQTPSLRASLGKVFERLPTPSQQSKSASQWAELILDRIADPLMMRGPALRVGWAIVHGRLDERHLNSVLRRLDELRAAKKLTRTPSAYFNGTMRRMFFEIGIPWGDKP